MITARENLERLFNHDTVEYIPNLSLDTHIIMDTEIERPVFHTGYDAWGCHWIECPESLNMTHPDTSVALFEEINEWRDVVKIPDVEKVDFSAMKQLFQGYDDNMRTNKMLQYISMEGIFERSHELMGFENALCEFMTDPEEYGEMLSAFADYKIKLFAKVFELFQPDILIYHDDMGSQQSQFLPTLFYEKYLFPNYKRIVDAARAIGYKHVIQHSCGRIEAILPQWLSCGFDGIDSLMPCNDLKNIKKEYGGKILFFPGGDCQEILGVKGIAKEKIEEMVLRYYDILAHDAKDLCMDNSVAYSINPENEKICCELQLKHRKSYVDAVKAGEKYVY